MPPADCVAKGCENDAGGESLTLAELLALDAPDGVSMEEKRAVPLAAALAECKKESLANTEADADGDSASEALGAGEELAS